MIGVVTATGAVTSVGLSARGSCAAIRGGLARPSPLSLPVVDAESQELVAVTGHPLVGYADGFQLLGRWIRLARGAVTDLLAGQGVPPPADAAFWGRTGLLAVTALPDDDVFLTDRGGALKAIEADYLAPLRRALPGIPASAVALVARGPAGTAVALGLAQARLAAGLDRVLVVAVDSLVDPVLLQNLLADGRLKTDDAPTGLAPGEGAAAILVETAASARGRGATPLASLPAAASAQEPVRPELPGTGRALAECVERVLDESGAALPFAGELVVDLNGESSRAQEWGQALVRLGAKLGRSDARVLATSLGDTGAASGALGVCYGVHLLLRGVARRDVVVLSRSDAGTAGCVAIRRA